MRNTKQRDLVLNIINESCTHPTAEEIYFECKKQIKNISLGTVYRNLNSLVDLRKIKRLKMSNHIDRFDKETKHIHFICIRCDKIIDIYEHNILNYTNLIGKNKVLDCKISLEGICEECLKKEGEK
ncbi:MAG: transcriptional repressor [Bacilli bacterium]